MRPLRPEEFAPPGHPGDIDFIAWLAERTPPGAPTLLMRAPGVAASLSLPQLRPASLSPPRGRRRRGAAPALHAAYLVDVVGLSPRQLAGSGLPAFSNERAARQHVRDGRFVGAELGLWPWTVVGGQALSRSWWADERFALALMEWARAEVRPPEVEPSVRRLGAQRHLAAARLPIA